MKHTATTAIPAQHHVAKLVMGLTGLALIALIIQLAR